MSKILTWQERQEADNYSDSFGISYMIAEIRDLRTALASTPAETAVAWGLQMPTEPQPRLLWIVKDVPFNAAMARWPESYAGAYQIELFGRRIKT